MAMASLLAMSLLWALPSSAPPVAAWAPPVVPNAARTRLWPSHHRALLCLASVPPPAVATDESAETLEYLTVPELKERLRSMGQKVTGNKSELIERLMQQCSDNDDATTHIIDDVADESNLDPSVEQLPEPLREALLRYSSSSATASSPSVSPKLLPVQQQSYRIISEGQDAVLFSPTGTGKTLAYTLPLAARLWGWKHDGSLQHQKQAQKQRFMRQQNRNRNDSLSSQPVDPATPSILVVEPSRELARQVGKVWAKFHPTAARNNKRQVVTVYGGVPMARHAAMLGSKTDVVIGTPGRIRELIREKYLSTAHLRSVVLDEADTLLNFKDNPEVEWLLEGMQNDYQLVLASATVNKRVEKFVGDVMELEVSEEGYVVVEADDTDAVDAGDLAIDDGIELDPDASSDVNTANGERSRPTVQHWSMAASAASRIGLTSDLIVTMSPRRGIIFAPSKAEVEAVAQELTERLSSANDVSVHILHGDMVQAARGRTVNAFRADTDRMTRLLVATDVASRGLDLPAVDLVLQYGVPRKTGKEGTFDEELYIHRTGRAGRYGNTRAADAIMLYDRSQGEAATLAKLQEEMDRLHGTEIMTRPLPSPKEVMEASYERAVSRCVDFEERKADGDGQSLVQYFADRLSQDLEASGDGKSEEKLVHRLAAAMAALSGLDGVVPPRSLLTADPRDRTIRVWTDTSDSANPLSPPEVTKVVKALGSGKLGRITICSDGSAVFDLGAKKADRLLQNASDDDELKSWWHLEIPSSLE